MGQSSLFLGCPLSLEDDSRDLLLSLALADELCIVAPIYFYHLPSRFKALLDRLQPFWHLRQAGVDPLPTERRCKVILLGARRKGRKLFSGSVLTLNYSLGLLNYQLHDPLFLYGLDGPQDLLADASAIEKISAYANG